jgi:hypothetical protein
LNEDLMRDIYDTIERDPITLQEDDEKKLELNANKATSMRKKNELFLNELEFMKKKGVE